MKNKKYKTIPVTLDHLRRINWGHNYNPTLDKESLGHDSYSFAVNEEERTLALFGETKLKSSEVQYSYHIYSYRDWNLYDELQNVL